MQRRRAYARMHDTSCRLRSSRTQAWLPRTDAGVEAAILAMHPTCSRMSAMNAIPAAVLEELAPTGSVRAAINFGNPVLAQQDLATGEARGVSVDLARETGRGQGVDVQLV